MINNPQQIWLIVLLFLWAALLFGGFFFGKLPDDRIHRMPTWTRMLSSFTLVGAGWSWFMFCTDTAVHTYALLIAIGMSLGFLGDLFMARLIPVKEYVLCGIGAFALGHIAYIAALIDFGDSQNLDTSSTRWIALTVFLLIGAVSWYFVVARGQERTVLHWAALPYALLLSSTCGFAAGLAWQAPAFTGLAIGSVLFLTSDLILAAQLFNGLRFKMIGDIIWLTYGPGQMLIVYSIGTALANAIT